MVSIIGVAVLGYCAVVGFLFVFQRRFLYAPDATRPDPAACGVPEMRIVTLEPADGVEIYSWYSPPNGAEGVPIIVYFHGNAEQLGTRAGRVRHFLDAGFGVLLVSYRGYGGNPGRPTETGLYADARAALGFLRGEQIGQDRIVLYGESLGSGVAVQLAWETTPAALILEAPYSSIGDVAARRFPFAPIRLLLRDRFDSRKKIGAVNAPLLVLHGERDRTVPIDLGRKLFAAAREPKEACYFADAAHTDLYDFGAAAEVIRFLRALPRFDPRRHGAPDHLSVV